MSNVRATFGPLNEARSILEPIDIRTRLEIVLERERPQRKATCARSARGEAGGGARGDWRAERRE